MFDGVGFSLTSMKKGGAEMSRNVSGKRKSAIAGVPVAYIAVFTALYVIAAFIPTIALLGSGATISAAAILTALNGILLGPVAGGLVSLIGGFIAAIVAPHTAPLGLAGALFVCVNSVVAGFAVEKRKWFISAIILALGIVLNQVIGIGKDVWWYGWGYALFLVLLVSPLRIWAKRGWDKRNRTLMGVLAFLAGGAGAMVDHCFGTLAWYYMYNVPIVTWRVIGTVYLLERIPLILAGALLSVALIWAFDKIRMPLRIDKIEPGVAKAAAAEPAPEAEKAEETESADV